MTTETLNQAISILRAEGVERVSSIALRRFATANNITCPWELATAWMERD